MPKLEIRVSAGPHERVLCPVAFVLDGEQVQAYTGEVESVILIDEDEQEVPWQCETCEEGELRVSWILDYLPANAEKRYTFLFNEGSSALEGGVELEEDGQEIRVSINGDYFTSYNFEYAKPCLAPTIGPYGDRITRFEPENPEHPHQRSIYFAHGDINGIDAWNEPENKHGKVEVDKLCTVEGGPVYGEIVTRNTWTDFPGNPLVGDVSRIRIYNLPRQGRIIDKTLTYEARHGKVELGPTKEAGPLGVRVAPSMTVRNGGRIVNSYGAINEPETWGKRAPWCDYTGWVEGNQMGIAVFDNPGNDCYPTYWHVRNYGLMAPNNFFFSGGRTLNEGESMTFAYRIFLHAGDTSAARVGERFHDYVNPPEIEIVE